MPDPIQDALANLQRICAPGPESRVGPIAFGGSASPPWRITINFHPDMVVADATAIEQIARDGVYRSQFETGVSSGGLTAYQGGDRWNWESRIFGGAYDGEHVSLRPKYGALNHRNDLVGGSRRFGSSHFRLRSSVRSRASFCYPDSHLQPSDFAVDNVDALIALAEANELELDRLDNYIEAHVHGPVRIREDIEAVVLDPSFRGTAIEDAAHSLGCAIEWHDGFCLSVERRADCARYRGPGTASAIESIAKNRVVTPAILWQARERLLDYQTAKWVWHCVARYGHV